MRCGRGSEYNAIIGAIATIVVAAFTGTLWFATSRLYYATKIAAEAARDSASALPTVERAYIFVGPDKVEHVVASNTARVHLLIKNFGRTPGVLKKVYGQFSDFEPSAAVYSGGRIFITDAALGPQDQIPPIDQLGRGLVFLSADPGAQFFFRYIEYIDVFKRPHFSRFCTLINPALGSFELRGAPELNDFD